MSSNERKDANKWFGSLAKDWSTVRIKTKFKVFNGATPKSDVFEYWDGEIAWATPADMYGVERITETKRKITEAGYNSCATTLVPVDSIVLSTRAPIGQVSIAGVELCTNQGCKTLVSFSDGNNKYLFYLLSVSGGILNSLGKGTTFLEISTSDLSNYEIPFPSITKQNLIVRFLDEKCSILDRLIALQEEMIAELQAYKQSIITEAVTKGLNPDVPMKTIDNDSSQSMPEDWNIGRMKYFIQFNPRNNKVFDDDSIVSFAPMECIGNGTLESKEIEYGRVNSSYTFFAEGDIVLAKVTPCFENGNIAKATNLQQGIGFGSSELFIIRPTKLHPGWLYYYLQNDNFKEAAKSTMTGTGGLKRVSPQFVTDHSFTYPSYEEQSAISDNLDRRCFEISELINVKKSKSETLKEYKQSLIYECVTGKRDCSGGEASA